MTSHTFLKKKIVSKRKQESENMKFKQYTREEWETFCDDNFIEDENKVFWNFIKDFKEVNLSSRGEGDERCLTIKVKLHEC